jgi:hypothetical protein
MKQRFLTANEREWARIFLFALISVFSRLRLVRVGWDNMKNSVAKRNKDLRKIKTRGRCRPRVFCMRMPVLAAGPRGSVLAQNRKGVYSPDFIVKLHGKCYSIMKPALIFHKTFVKNGLAY